MEKRSFNSLLIVSLALAGCQTRTPMGNHNRTANLFQYTPYSPAPTPRQPSYQAQAAYAMPPQQPTQPQQQQATTAAPPQPAYYIEAAAPEETYYVPTALQTTRSDEIEIVSFEQVIEETPPSPTAAEPVPKPKSVKVRQGDTLYSIAATNKVKVYDLARRNDIGAPYIVKVGQTLEIPDGMAEPAPAPAPRTIITHLDAKKSFIEEPKVDSVTVKKGDTIYSIAKNNSVPLKDVLLRNNLEPPYTLRIGQKIYMPSTAFHIVKKQDTMYSISRKYGVNLNSLAKLNGISEPYTLSIGQKITLPAATGTDRPVQKVIVAKPEAKPKIVEIKKPASPPIVATPVTEVEITKGEKAREQVERIIARPEPLASRRFMWPVDGKIISEFGAKAGGKRNDGINLQATLGTKVRAAENGIVAYAGNELKGLGNLIIIRHDKDYMTVYAHNDALSIRQGEAVKRGDVIAMVGKTGRVTTPQLHFEIRQKTASINPISLLERR